MKQLVRPLKQRLRKQRGAISLLGVASIAVSLFAFNQVMEFGNAKLLDRKLDNYARTVASVALRSELAITKKAIDEGAIPANKTSLVVDDLLTQVGMYTQATDDNAVNLNKTITFGNFDENGDFVELDSDSSNPRAAETPPDFSAVAVQLWSDQNSFYGFTPQGKAIYGLDAENIDDQDCYCKNRYESCRGADLSDVAWAGEPYSDSRKNYCNYGYTDSKISNADETKYPYIEFNDAWIGRPPETINFWMFYSKSYDGEAFDAVLNQKTVLVTKGDDPLKNTSGWSTWFDMSKFFCFFGCSSSDLPARLQDESIMKKSDIPSSIRSEYICEKPGFMMLPTTYPSCDSANNSNAAVLNDSIYIGYQGTCVPGTDSGNLAMSRCLAYEEDGVSRYQSCLDIERNSSMQMNFFERMMAFFFGPVLNWERSYEGLNCEMKKMRYKGWMFWGGWQDV